MKYYVMTLFPEMVEQGLNTSILKRAAEAGAIEFEAVNIRDYSEDKHKRVDDYPYGGGAGMVLQAEPIYRCYEAVQAKIGKEKKTRMIALSPAGRVFDQSFAEELSAEENLIFLCGHYEGIDERVLERITTDYVSIGDYILTGGELPAMVMIDAVSRLVPGVLSNGESAVKESFSDYLLEYPQYTRPEEILGKKVPEILLSGHHANIEKWRREKSLELTKEKRPDLYEKYLAIHTKL